MKQKVKFDTRGIYYRQDCSEVANCRYWIYSQPENQHFRPAGATHCTNSLEIWHSRGDSGSAWLCKISRQSVHGSGNVALKLWKFPLLG